MYTNNNNIQSVDIHINTTDFWNIIDYRIVSYPQSWIYIHASNQFNSFYQNLQYTINTSNNLVVSLHDFLEFKRLNNSIERSFFNSVAQHMSPTGHRSDLRGELVPTNIATTIITTSSQNNTIKHELADLVFDIKDQLKDSTYKDILEKIAELST
jgi:hypothetical protein